MMISTRLSSRSFQSMINDETLCDDLTTLNQNSSSSILYHTLNIHCISEEYILRKSNILSSSHIDALFLNWPSLTRIHEKLANALLTALKTEGEQISIGNVLCQLIPQLITEYEIYFRFHPTAMKCFREHFKLSSKFRSFMQVT
ncbi:unnamed protein product [Rotaria sp. Silwood2]|nr:unnamed protein product [Rotaria sp. Silwood2]CAF3503182.1 unnamed protein product [Rotaria sp. Silwood2]